MLRMNRANIFCSSWATRHLELLLFRICLVILGTIRAAQMSPPITEMDQEDEEYLIPLQDQRFFGAGIKRRRVQFVPPVPVSSSRAQPTVTHETSAASQYQSIVLPSSQNVPDHKTKYILKDSHEQGRGLEDSFCEICKLTVQPCDPGSSHPSKPHEASLVHQACLSHSHPPSHLDRNHKGLQYLSSYGWDPDSRLGLGTLGEGRRFPIKPKVKNDTLGLGVQLARESQKGTGGQKSKEEKLDAKGIRKRGEEEKKKSERLRQLFYQSEEVNRYLQTEV